jgi:hypothetical protein
MRLVVYKGYQKCNDHTSGPDINSNFDFLLSRKMVLVTTPPNIVIPEWFCRGSGGESGFRPKAFRNDGAGVAFSHDYSPLKLVHQGRLLVAEKQENH